MLPRVFEKYVTLTNEKQSKVPWILLQYVSESIIGVSGTNTHMIVI